MSLVMRGTASSFIAIEPVTMSAMLLTPAAP